MSSRRGRCGLTQEKLLELNKVEQTIVKGRCQMPYEDDEGIEQSCGCLFTKHHSELEQGKFSSVVHIALTVADFPSCCSSIS
jgi:hypothetical protein